MSHSRKIALIGIYAAVAMAAGYMERFIPLYFGIPGMPLAKLGLANVAVLFALYTLDAKAAFGISIVRILVGGAAYVGLHGLLYSLAGGLLSFACMTIAHRSRLFSPIGISMLGGATHNWAQLAVASVVVHNAGLFRLSPALTLTGLAAGALTGLATAATLRAFPTFLHKPIDRQTK